MVLSGRLHPSTPPRDWVHLRLVTGQNTRLLRTRQIGHGIPWHGALGFCAYFLFLPLPATSLGSHFGQQPLSIQATTPSARLPYTESARAYEQLLFRVQKIFRKFFAGRMLMAQRRTVKRVLCRRRPRRCTCSLQCAHEALRPIDFPKSDRADSAAKYAGTPPVPG